MADLEKIKKISIIDVSGSLGLHLKRVGRYYTLKEHDSVRIDPERNVFFRNSTGECGSVIDFVKVFSWCSTADAINYLESGFSIPVTSQKKQYAPYQKQNFKLPEADSDMRNIFAYLVKTRCIDPKIVKKLVENKYLYQDKRKNCVFVGYRSGLAVFAALRGTNTFTKFVGDVSGSDYSVCFFVPGDGKGDESVLTVTESPIDAMSVMNMSLIESGCAFTSDYLALCGCSKAEKAIKNYVLNKRYKSIRLCLDNDAAGRRAEDEIGSILKNIGFEGEIISCMPVAKDMNEELIMLKSEE